MSLARAIRASLIAGLVAAPMSPAMAEIQWNGFLSVGAGMTFDDDEKFAGYDEDLSFAPDSILGLQASADLGENLSVTGQLVARGDTSDVKAEWLYLSYQLNPNLRVNLGRQRMPLFLYSDYVDVGYAYHFQRPPTSVYLSPINSIDAISVLYDRYLTNSLEAKLQLFAGSYQEDGVEYEGKVVDLELTDTVGGSFTLVYDDWLTFRAVLAQSKIAISGDVYDRLYNEVAPGAAQLGLTDVAKAFDGEPVTYTFAGVALSAELGNYLFVAEATDQDMSKTDQKQSTYYVSLARRFGNLMPYVTLERNEVHTNNDLYRDIPFIADDSITLPNGKTLQEVHEGIRASVATYMAGNDRNEYLYSVGVRYDFHPSAALKVQYTHVDDQRKKFFPAAGVTSRDANLISFSIDTVF